MLENMNKLLKGYASGTIPLDSRGPGIGSALGIESSETLTRLMFKMEATGRISRIKRDRYGYRLLSKEPITKDEFNALPPYTGKASARKHIKSAIDKIVDKGKPPTHDMTWKVSDPLWKVTFCKNGKELVFEGNDHELKGFFDFITKGGGRYESEQQQQEG